jgi:hypothetical protein
MQTEGVEFICEGYIADLDGERKRERELERDKVR